MVSPKMEGIYEMLPRITRRCSQRNVCSARLGQMQSLPHALEVAGTAAESPESLAAWLAGINAELPTATFDESVLTTMVHEEAEAESRRAEALRVLGGRDA